MEYIVTSDSFTKISETAGTLQNLDKENEIEMSESPVFDSGLRVKTGEKLNFSNTDIYLRCVKDGGTAIVRIVPFSVDVKGGDDSSVDTTALKSVALVGNALNFYTSSDTAQAAAYSIDIPAEQFIDQAATTFVSNFYFSAILYPDAVNPNLNGKPVFVLGVKTKSNDGLSNTVKYSFIDVSKLVDTYVASDTSVTVSDYKFKVNISPDAGNYLRLKSNGLFAGTITDTATSSALGLTKLYGTTGANTDGTLTQSAITAELAAKLDSDAKAVSATTADKLSTARSLKVSLSSSSAPTFDGSANVTIGVGGILPTTYGGTGNASGTVSGAAQLNTSRNFITNLASTIAGGFNGTASVSAGITGTLPVANGGTGQTNLDNVTVGKAIKDNSGNVITDTYATKTALSAGLNSKLDSDATAAAAFKDSSGNVITDTYVTKSELNHKLAAVRYGYRIKKDEADPDLRVEYLYDAAGMRPAHMVFDTDTETAGTDSDTSYFDYGDWQSVWFVRDNKPLMLKSDGTVDYYLDPNDYSKCAEPVTRTVIVDTDTQATESITFTDSEVADSTYDGNAMAQIPLCWVYRYEDDDYCYEIVSNVQWDDNYKAYAHTDINGNIQPYFYWAMYFSSRINSELRSLSNKSIISQRNFQNLTADAKATGSDHLYIASWSQMELLRTLLMLMAKSTNLFRTFGKGYTSTVSGTDWSIKTGAGDTKGQFYGCKVGKRPLKTFHIADISGKHYFFVAGTFSNQGKIYAKMTPQNGGYPLNTTSGYKLVSNTFNKTWATEYYAKDVFLTDFGMFPKSFDGSSSTYFRVSYLFGNRAYNCFISWLFERYYYDRPYNMSGPLICDSVFIAYV